MSEREVNARRNWKAQTFPYDYYTIEPGRECQYCLTEKQAELLLGLIEPLGWSTRWWSATDAEINKDTIDALKSDISGRLMTMCCCGDIPIQYRWTEDGVLQSSDNGGETWQDSPENDPRNNSTIYPPIEGEDGGEKKCVAATGMAALIEEQVGGQLTDEMTRYTLQQLITDWINIFIQTSNIFTALITIATNQIFALSIAVIRPALTEEVYDKLKCIFYCNMGDDATFNNAQWEEVRSQILSEITGVAGIFLEHLVYLLGSVGLTNLARSSGATTGDCSDCDCLEVCGSNWLAGFYFGGVIQHNDTLDDQGEGYIIVNSYDRGDGVQTAVATAPNAASGCWFNWTFLDHTPSAPAPFKTACDVVPSYENRGSPNYLMPNPTSGTSFWIESTGGDAATPFRLRLDFDTTECTP